jgi:hypothetical protein
MSNGSHRHRFAEAARPLYDIGLDSVARMGEMHGLQRFMGGSPGQVLLRLVVVSFIVGIVLSALGLTPGDILDKARQLFFRIWNMGFGAFEWIWTYFLLGAVIVIPVWIVLRLLNMNRS